MHIYFKFNGNDQEIYGRWNAAIPWFVRVLQVSTEAVFLQGFLPVTDEYKLFVSMGVFV